MKEKRCVFYMERNVTFEEISDGRRYGLNDMVKVGCNGCEGCSKCCTGMGSSIILTPYDVNLLMKNLNCPFEKLLEDFLELGVENGVILPHIRMKQKNGIECCGFLNEEGRCSIHQFRPGVCRLFPLGRLYEDGKFCYFLQTGECQYPNKTKVKVRKWIDIDDIEENSHFINLWHDTVKAVQKSTALDENSVRKINMMILSEIFVKGYGENFYKEFEDRCLLLRQKLSEEGVCFE